MYKVMIIGAGNQGAFCDIPGSGKEHKIISHAKGFTSHHGFELVGFHDTSEQAMSEAAIEWETDWFYSLDEAWDAYDIDIVSICTPDETHYDILNAILKYNPKLVLCEKPLTTNLEQARSIVEKYNQRKIPILVNYTRRFIPQLQELRRKIRGGEFGKYLYGCGFFNRGWLHTGTHMVDFIRWLFDDSNFDIEEIKNTDYRIYQVNLFFEHGYWREESQQNSVHQMYDFHMFYVADNIYRYLTSGEKLLCTGKEALKTLELSVEIMVEGE